MNLNYVNILLDSERYNELWHFLEDFINFMSLGYDGFEKSLFLALFPCQKLLFWVDASA